MAIKTKFQDSTFKVGDIVRVHHTFTTGEKAQTQIFEGLVIGIRGRGENKSFTVRKISFDGVGVEKIWPLSSPSLTKITVKRAGTARRAKLNYLKSRIGKEALRVKVA